MRRQFEVCIGIGMVSNADNNVRGGLGVFVGAIVRWSAVDDYTA
jgi:hypothetical protein